MALALTTGTGGDGAPLKFKERASEGWPVRGPSGEGSWKAEALVLGCVL